MLDETSVPVGQLARISEMRFNICSRIVAKIIVVEKWFAPLAKGGITALSTSSQLRVYVFLSIVVQLSVVTEIVSEVHGTAAMV